jgi:hypothetical protein
MLLAIGLAPSASRAVACAADLRYQTVGSTGKPKQNKNLKVKKKTQTDQVLDGLGFRRRGEVWEDRPRG